MKRTIGILVVMCSILLGAQTLGIAKTAKAAGKSSSCSAECTRPCGDVCPLPCPSGCEAGQTTAAR